VAPVGCSRGARPLSVRIAAWTLRFAAAEQEYVKYMAQCSAASTTTSMLATWAERIRFYDDGSPAWVGRLSVSISLGANRPGYINCPTTQSDSIPLYRLIFR
jgi:hypothetical protein